jgi:antitoxin component of MazEF toxin-antitoxin module
MPEPKRSIVQVQAIGSNSVTLTIDNRTVAVTRTEARALAYLLEEAAMECETEKWEPMQVEVVEAHGARRGRR